MCGTKAGALEFLLTMCPAYLDFVSFLCMCLRVSTHETKEITGQESRHQVHLRDPCLRFLWISLFKAEGMLAIFDF